MVLATIQIANVRIASAEMIANASLMSRVRAVAIVTSRKIKRTVRGYTSPFLLVIL